MPKYIILVLLGLSLGFISACGVGQDERASMDPGVSTAEVSISGQSDSSDKASSQTSIESIESLVFETTWESPTLSAETSESNDSGLSLALEPPAGWDRAEDSFFLAKFTKGTATFLVSEESFFSESDLGDVVSEAKQMLTGVFDEVVFVGEADTRSIDGHEGRHFLMTCLVNGVPVTSSYTYLALNGTIYSFILSETSDLWPELVPEEDVLFANIEIQ